MIDKSHFLSYQKYNLSMKNKPISESRLTEIKHIIQDISSVNDRFNHGIKMSKFEKFLIDKYRCDESLSLANVPVMIYSYGKKRNKIVEGDEQNYAIVSLVEKYIKDNAFISSNTKGGKTCFFYGKACYELALLVREDVDSDTFDFKTNQIDYYAIPYELTGKRKIKVFGNERLGDVIV
jgi:hypothetical protein